MHLAPNHLPSMSAAAIALRAFAPVFLSGAIAACGGGDDSAQGTASPSPAASTPTAAAAASTSMCETPSEGSQGFAQVQGAVGGTIIGRSDPSFILLQSPDAVGRGFDRWLIYGPDLAQAPVITGVIYSSSGGVGCYRNDLTAVNGRDWGAGGDNVYLRTEIGDRGAGAVLLDGGSLRYRTAPPATYTLGPRPLPGIEPNHTLAPALLASVIGSWTLNDMSRVGMSLDVAADGALKLRYRGCSLKGSLRAGDGGLYSVAAWYELGSCANYMPAFEGVALAYPLASGEWQIVFAVTTNNGVDSDQIITIGRR